MVVTVWLSTVVESVGVPSVPSAVHLIALEARIAGAYGNAILSCAVQVVLLMRPGSGGDLAYTVHPDSSAGPTAGMQVVPWYY